jgi:hypothetical protein
LKVLISNCVCFAQTTQLPQSVWLGSIDGRTRRGNKKKCLYTRVGGGSRPSSLRVCRDAKPPAPHDCSSVGWAL